MSDFTVFNLQYNNAATDAGAVWTGTALTFAGGSPNNELRFSSSTTPPASGANTSATNWPYVTRPGSVGVVNQAWAIVTDGSSGAQIQTYDGTSAHYMQFRWNWDVNGTFAAAPQFGAFGDSTHTPISAGTQPGGQSGSPIVNGQVTDTGSTSYLKANAFGYGVDAAGAQQTPAANAAGTLTASSNSVNGGASPTTGAWLAVWQDLQGFTHYILDGVVPKAATAGFWYFLLSLWTGPNMSTGTLLPVITLQYSYS